MTAAAFQGTFFDFKTIKTRGQCQFVIEVPIEQADAALAALGGIPKPGNDVWVGVARLDLAVAKNATTQERLNQNDNNHADNSEKHPSKGLTRKWDELSPAEQAGIRCNEDKFQSWITDHDVWGERLVRPTGFFKDDARTCVLESCNISSRAELNTNKEAAAIWREIDKDYQWYLSHGEIGQ